MRAVAVLIAVALALVGAGCGGGTQAKPSPRKPQSNSVTELKDVGQLRAAFNAHDGVPRLIVLASPT
jgi:hypothetical protein